MALKPKLKVSTKHLTVEVPSDGRAVTISYEIEKSQKVYAFPIKNLQGVSISNTVEETTVSLFVLTGNDVTEYNFEVSGVSVKELNEIHNALTSLL